MSETSTAPAKTSTQNGGRRGRGAPAMKFLGSLRGEGVLLLEAGEAAVHYQLDVFEGGIGRSGSGAVDGDMPAGAEDGEARLRMADGREIAVTLQSLDEAGASFETRGAVPSPE